MNRTWILLTSLVMAVLLGACATENRARWLNAADGFARGMHEGQPVIPPPVFPLTPTRPGATCFTIATGTVSCH